MAELSTFWAEAALASWLLLGLCCMVGDKIKAWLSK